MTDEPHETATNWTDRPLYATWPGRVFLVLLFIVPDVCKTVYPDTWGDIRLRLGWYFALAVVVGVFWLRARASRRTGR